MIRDFGEREDQQSKSDSTMGNILPSFCCFNIDDQRCPEDVSCCGNINNEEEVGTPWSELPDLALYTVLMHLRGEAASTAFRGVCRAWRAVAISASRPPILASLPSKGGKISLLDLHDNNLTYSKPLLETRKLSYVGQSHGYLIMKSMKKRKSSKSFTLVVIDPCTSATWEFATPQPVTTTFQYEFCLLSAAPTSPNCLLFLLSFSIIQWCRVGGSRWSRWQPPGGPYFSSSALVYKEKVLYWTDWRGQICEMDLQQCSYESEKPLLKRTVLDGPDFEWPHNVEPVLAELDGQLFMITVSYTDNLNFKRPFVYRLDLSSETEKRWVKMESLGFYSVFVSGSNCEIYDTRRVEGLLSNCVYYATNSMNYNIESLNGAVKKSGDRVNFWTDKTNFWIHYKVMGSC